MTISGAIVAANSQAFYSFALDQIFHAPPAFAYGMIHTAEIDTVRTLFALHLTTAFWARNPHQVGELSGQRSREIHTMSTVGIGAFE